jgi:hypothetical protein
MNANIYFYKINTMFVGIYYSSAEVMSFYDKGERYQGPKRLVINTKIEEEGWNRDIKRERRFKSSGCGGYG